MAYFLDPELAALTAGKVVRTTVSAAPAASGARRKNKFGKSCHGCGKWVKAAQGYLGQENGAWVVYCTSCP